MKYDEVMERFGQTWRSIAITVCSDADRRSAALQPA